MAIPSDKSPEIEKLFTDIFGSDRTSFIEMDRCTVCGQTVIGFKDDLSAREYTISGFCQECQDEVFGEDDE